MQQPSLNTVFDAEREYLAIESALLESARGRWFLAEHGRRARRLDSALLEDAIGRLKTSLREPPALLGQLKFEIEQICAFVAETRGAMMAKPPSQPIAEGRTAEANASPVRSILRATEDLHELAWSLQANDINPDACTEIARHASQIYAMSHVQAVELHRTIQFSSALESISARLSALLQTIGHEMQIDTGGAPALVPPPA